MVFESTRLRGLIRTVEKELSATTRELASYGQQGQDIIDILNDKVTLIVLMFQTITFLIKRNCKCFMNLIYF